MNGSKGDARYKQYADNRCGNFHPAEMLLFGILFFLSDTLHQAVGKVFRQRHLFGGLILVLHGHV